MNVQQQLQRLEQERERLRAMGTQVDSHAQEFVSALQKKRSHLANIASLEVGVALAGRCHRELGELYSGTDYQRAMAHIEHFQTTLASRGHQLAAQIEELRQQMNSEVSG